MTLALRGDVASGISAFVAGMETETPRQSSRERHVTLLVRMKRNLTRATLATRLGISQEIKRLTEIRQEYSCIQWLHMYMFYQTISPCHVYHKLPEWRVGRLENAASNY